MRGLGVFERDWGHRWYCSFFHVQIVLLCDVNVTSEELGSLSVRSMEVYDGGVELRISTEIREQETEHKILEPMKIYTSSREDTQWQMQRAELPLTNRMNAHLQNKRPDVCPQEVAVFGKSGVFLLRDQKPRTPGSGPKIRYAYHGSLPWWF